MLDAHIITQDHYKATARLTDSDAINGEDAICSFAPGAGQRALFNYKKQLLSGTGFLTGAFSSFLFAGSG
jgi:hypothetical protein